MDFNVEVKQINDSDLDILFGGSPKKDDKVFNTVNEDDENNHQEQEEEGLDSLFEKTTLVKEKELKEVKAPLTKEEPKLVKEKVKEEVKVDETDIENLFTSDEKSNDKDLEVKGVFKNIVDYFIDNKLWVDFDGRDEIEYNNETFEKLVVAQNNFKVQEMFNELVDNTGEYGKAIISHIKSGGDLDTIIDLFKLEKETDSIDINNIDGQEKLIYQYYSEDEIGWSKEKIKKYIDNLKLDDELESESKDIKAKYDKLFSKRLESINQERLDEEQVQKEKIQQYKSTVVNTLKQREDLSDKERLSIADYMLNYDQKLNDGQTVNKFYVKLLGMQNDVNEFIYLVNFVMDKQSYLKKINTKAETKATKKTFEFIKSSNALSNKNSGISLNKPSTDEDATNLFNKFI